MKRCPTCNRTFDEEWLAFCTEDGSTLLEASSAPLPQEPPPTVRIPSAPDTNPNSSQRFDLPGSYNQPPPVAPAWQPPPPPPMRQGTGQKQGFAVASLILGIISLTVGWCCYFGVITGPIAIGLGITSLIQIKNNPKEYTGKPLAIIGIATGAVYFLLVGLIIMIYGLGLLAGGMQ